MALPLATNKMMVIINVHSNQLLRLFRISDWFMMSPGLDFEKVSSPPPPLPGSTAYDMGSNYQGDWGYDLSMKIVNLVSYVAIFKIGLL